MQDNLEIEAAIKKAKNTVLKKSDEIECKNIIKGYDFNEGTDYSKLFDVYKVIKLF